MLHVSFILNTVPVITQLMVCNRFALKKLENVKN